MATAPLTFSEFKSRCLRICCERDPPEEAHCSLCTEEYDRSDHQANRIVLQPPAQCNHEFCRSCLKRIFSFRKMQESANLCPLCRAVWFRAEYESLSARSQHLVEEATNALPANNFEPQPFVPGPPATPNGTAPNTTRRGTSPVPPPTRTPRPYMRTRQPPPPVAQPPTAPRDTQYRANFRAEPVYLHREVHAAFARERATAERTGPQPATSGPYRWSDFNDPSSGAFPFGRQGAPDAVPTPRVQESSARSTSHRPAQGAYKSAPNGSNTTRGSGQGRAVPPPATAEAELQLREEALYAREARLMQREEQLARDCQALALQEREQEFNAFSEQTRRSRRNHPARM